jgi:predicted small integral membrane protein
MAFMKSTAYVFRIGKIIAMLGIGLMSLLVTLGNITDYYSNYYFVQHVMKMDTIFPGSDIHYRSIQSPVLYHTGYIILIVLETWMTFSCLKGGLNMYKKRKSTSVDFHAAKKWAAYGLITGIVIWFVGFEVIGGEWFGMWQSTQWNGLYSADRILTFITLIFISLQIKEEELT